MKPLDVDYWKQETTTCRRLRDDFLSLLDEAHDEQTYQTYMESNTRLIPLEFVKNHGVHFRLVLRKLSIGADYKCDFCYLAKSSGSWNCVLVEIEKPTSRFLRANSTRRHADFDAALNQIDTWRAYLSDATNHAYVADQLLGFLRRPTRYNPVHFRFVLVHGRRSEFERAEERRRLVQASERSDLRIVTFDSLVEDLRLRHDLYVGVRHNEFVDIRSDLFLDEAIFGRLAPEQIRITSSLKANAEAARHQWYVRRSIDGVDQLVMQHALPRVRVVVSSSRDSESA